MDNKKLLRLNGFINKAYECFSFAEFLKLAILKLHEFVAYDSGMFFCGISKDCSFFKPYIGGRIENYYINRSFSEREEYLSRSEDTGSGNEAYVYKSSDYLHGIIQIANEPRGSFISEQKDFHIVCMRIVYKGQFMGEIYLHRSKDKPDFADEDMFTLQLMQPHVSTVFYIIHTVTAVKYLETNSHSSTGLGICMFDRDLSLSGGNVNGIDMLKAVTVYGSSVLYHIKEMCGYLQDNGTADSNKGVISDSKLMKTANGEMRIDILFNAGQMAGNKVEYVAIMEYCNEAQVTSDYKFKFTKREADIIDGLIQGKNNFQLAKGLSVSENTVKTHIKSIYKKTGANNRTELTYVLMLNR